MKFLKWATCFCGVSFSALGSSANYRLEARTDVKSSVNVEIDGAAFYPDPKARMNRPAHVKRMGRRALVDLGPIDLATRLGTMGKTYELPTGIRLVIDITMKARVSATPQAEMQVRLGSAAGNRFARAAIAEGSADWSRPEAGTPLTAAGGYSTILANGASEKKFQVAFDLGFHQTWEQKQDTLMVDVVPLP